MTHMATKRITLCMACLVYFAAACDFQWPISRGCTPDLPQYSPFGPRLLNGRHDYHRGIDIPAPVGTRAYAIADGKARIAGSHPGYADGVVQIRHDLPNGKVIYATYIHMLSSLVEEDQIVKKGDPVAVVGDLSKASYSHLHFEIREDGLAQKNCVNPWIYLPYTNKESFAVQLLDITGSTTIQSAAVSVSQMPTELDLDYIGLQVYDTSNKVVYSSYISFNEENRKYESASTLDNPNVGNIFIEPERFNGQATKAAYKFTFNSIGKRRTSVSKIVATVKDVHGRTVTRTLTITAATNIVYTIQKGNALTYALDGQNGGDNNQNVRLKRHNTGDANQQWIEIKRDNGFVSFQKKDTNFCLDGGDGGANLQNLKLWGCATSNQNQHWKKVSVSGDKFRLQKRNAPGYSIDGNNGGAQFQNVYLWRSANQEPNQQWKFNAVASARASDTSGSLRSNKLTAGITLIIIIVGLVWSFIF